MMCRMFTLLRLQKIKIMQESALLAKSFPSKKRGVIWLVISLLLFFAEVYVTVLIVVFGSIAAFGYFIKIMGLFMGNIAGMSDAPNGNIDSSHFIWQIWLLIGIFALTYWGIWYGVSLIVASYKQYSFKKARVLALILALGTVLALILYDYAVKNFPPL